MNFKLLSEADKIIFEKAMIDMLNESDNDFVPPLSARVSTLDKGFSAERKSGGVESYFAEMRKQKILGAFDEGDFIGFVSFRENFTSEEIKRKKDDRGVGIDTVYYKRCKAKSK